MKGLNVVIVVLDTLSAGGLSRRGSPVEIGTPTLNELARHGSFATGAVAPSNWTLPSHRAMVSGHYPIHVPWEGKQTSIPPTNSGETLAESLRRAGYECCMFSEQEEIVADELVTRGYEIRFRPVFRRMRGPGSKDAWIRLSSWNVFYNSRFRELLESYPSMVLPVALAERLMEVSYKRAVCGSSSIASFAQWLEQRKPDRPFHALVNLVDAHEPYDHSDRLRDSSFSAKVAAIAPRYYVLSVEAIRKRVPWSVLREAYRDSARRADEKVRAIVDSLVRAGELDRTVFFVTSDHGQQFGEYGFAYHGNGFAEAVTRVPLIVRTPDGAPAFEQPHRFLSLTEFPSWVSRIISASKNLAPLDQPKGDGAPRLLDLTRPVYCDAGPASAQNDHLIGRFPDQSWNRWFVVSYSDEGKVALDLQSGEMVKWEALADFDTSLPKVVTADERLSTWQKFFAPRFRNQVGSVSHLLPVAPGVGVERRLTGWGY